MPTSERILVVEDEQNLATGIRYNLEAEGYEVTIAGDGPSALRFVEDAPDSYELIILDLMLPGMSGYAVCEAIRSFNREVPVLILSARTLAEDRARGFDVGANQYLTKPFELDEFLSRVKNLLALQGRGGARAGWTPTDVVSVEFGNARVNFETFEAVVAGKPVRLTQLEMSLLRYFVANQGRVIPRLELLENVWQIQGNVNSRAPDQFIRRLRKTFELDPARPRHFLTIRDAGYRFVAESAED